MDLKTRAGFTVTDAFTPDNLHAGDFPIRGRKVTIAAGQNLVRGALLGAITAGGSYTLSAAAAGDGSEVPTAILAEDTDATGGATEAIAYISGDFNEDAITYGAGHTADSVREGLRDLSIFLHKPVSA